MTATFNFDDAEHRGRNRRASWLADECRGNLYGFQGLRQSMAPTKQHFPLVKKLNGIHVHKKLQAEMFYR